MPTLQKYYGNAGDNTWRSFKDGSSGGTGGTGGPPVTGPWSSLLVGSCDDSFFDPLNLKLDGKLQVRRFYEGNFPITPGSNEIKDFNRGVIPYVSFSGPSTAAINNGSYDSTLAQYWGNSTQQKLVTYMHEPDATKKAIDPAQFKLAQQRIMTIKRANCPNNAEVLFGPTLMGYAFTTPQAPAAGYFRNWINPDYVDFIGSDPYRFWRPRYSPTIGTPSLPSPKTGSLGVKRSMAYLCGELPTWAAANGNIPLAIGEYSAHPDPENINDRAAWLQETQNYFIANNFIAVCYYHTRYGEDGPWWIDRFHTFSTGNGGAERDAGPADPVSLAKFRSFLPA